MAVIVDWAPKWCPWKMQYYILHDDDTALQNHSFCCSLAECWNEILIKDVLIEASLLIVIIAAANAKNNVRLDKLQASYTKQYLVLLVCWFSIPHLAG